jgi:hypothetical protein
MSKQGGTPDKNKTTLSGIGTQEKNPQNLKPIVVPTGLI